MEGTVVTMKRLAAELNLALLDCLEDHIRAGRREEALALCQRLKDAARQPLMTPNDQRLDFPAPQLHADHASG
jgi:hypothetical protein